MDPNRPRPILLRLLLPLLPRTFREEYGEEMVVLLQDRLEEAPRHRDRVLVLFRGLFDLVLTAFMEHRRLRSERHRRIPPTRGTYPMNQVFQDLRYALRGIRHAPGFALLSVLTLGLGIGATTVAFTLVHGILLQPLPFPDSEELVLLMEEGSRGRELMLSYPNFDDWRTQSRGFENIAAVQFANEASVLGGVEPARGTVLSVSREFFEVLGVPTLRGRPILPEENRPGGSRVAVASHGFWEGPLGGEENLEDLNVTLYGSTWQIVGVMPPGFQVLEDADLYIPMELSPVSVRSAHNYRGIGRLAAGTTLSQAREEMDRIAANIKSEYGDDSDAVGASLRPLQSAVVGDARNPLFLLLGASGLLLLIACTNQASTLLARGTQRQKEMAIRSAMGAARARLLFQLQTESFLIAALGGLAGLGLTFGTVLLLRTVGPALVPRLDSVTVDHRVLLFTLAATLLTSLLFGLLPAFRASGDVAGILRAARHHGSTRGRPLGWNLLVGIEVALAVVLVTTSGLLARSLQEILALDTQYQSAGILTIDLDPSGQGFDTEETRAALFTDLKRELAVVPGVASVGLTNRLPTDPGTWTGPVLRSPVTNREDRDAWAAIAGWRVVDEDYFATMGIPLREGRFFSLSEDRSDGSPVAILNQSLAERAFPGENPLGRQLQALWDRREEDFTVIGVVAEARDWRRAEGAQPELYVYWPQRIEHTGFMTAVLRTNASAAVSIAATRQAVRSVAPNMPLEVLTMDSRLGESLRERRFTLSVLGVFAGLALFLAAMGIFGVVSYSVSRRTREIGIRLALGAAPGLLRRGILTRSLGVVGAGAVAGLVIACTLGNVLESLLFAVSPRDPLALASAPLVLLLTGAAAIWIPMLRYTRVDPAEIMNAE